MPSEKIGILLHGGHTRRMMTIEIGRQSKRDVKFNDATKALEYVRTWLGVPASVPPLEAAERAATAVFDYGQSVEWGTGRRILSLQEMAEIILKHFHVPRDTTKEPHGQP